MTELDSPETHIYISTRGYRGCLNSACEIENLEGTLREKWSCKLPLKINLKNNQNSQRNPMIVLWKMSRDLPIKSSWWLIQWRFQLPYHKLSVPEHNIPSSPAYGVFISQLIWYSRACSSYECFILRAARLSSISYSDKDMSGNVWNRPLESFMVDMGISSNMRKKSPLPNVTWHSWTRSSTVTPLTDQTLHQFLHLSPNWTLLPILTLSPNSRGFHVEHCNGCG